MGKLLSDVLSENAILEGLPHHAATQSQKTRTQLFASPWEAFEEEVADRPGRFATLRDASAFRKCCSEVRSMLLQF